MRTLIALLGSPAFAVPVIVLMGLLILSTGGCTPRDRVVFQSQAPTIPASLKSCPPEPQAPDPDRVRQKAVDAYDNAVRAAGAVCRRNLKAVVSIVEGKPQ
jgi:hypothetical protein